MIKRTFDITARIEQGQIPFCFQVVQNDKDVYVLRIRITDGGQEIDYGEISDATITFALANGSVVQSDPERLAISSGGITYEMGTTEISCPGKVLASIQLIGSGGERLTTARFQFEVVADLISPKAVQSESRFPLLQQLVADVEQLKQDIVDLQIPDNSIMDEKLSNAAGQIKQRFASHLTDNAAHRGIIYRKNLLHNWDFRNLVNQRGQTEYTNIGGVGGLTIDRWRISDGGTVRIKNGSIELESTNFMKLSQPLENPHLYNGKTITVSVEIDGQIYSATEVVNFSQGTNPLFATATFPGGVAQVEYITQAQVFRFRFWINSGSTVSNITRVKLEFGSISTLANDPPADYGEQLMLCKRFFRLWTTEAARTEALKEVGLMRIPNPTLGTINIGGTTYYYASADLSW